MSIAAINIIRIHTLLFLFNVYFQIEFISHMSPIMMIRRSLNMKISKFLISHM